MIVTLLVLLLVVLATCCSCLIEIKQDTTFGWQMQKELLWELQAIRKQLEKGEAAECVANAINLDMLYRKNEGAE